MFVFRHSRPRVSEDQAHSRTSSATPDAILLDVREKPEWHAGHAPGAVHAPLSRHGAGAGLPVEAPGRPQVVVCRGGHRSRQPATLLTRCGAQAVDVKGGMNAWTGTGPLSLDKRGDQGRTA